MNSMRRKNDRTLKEEPPRSVGAQHAPGDQWRNNSRKDEGMQLRHLKSSSPEWNYWVAEADSSKNFQTYG